MISKENFTQKELHSAFRTFQDLADDVERSEWQIWDENLRHFLIHCEDNRVMQPIVQPLLAYSYEEWKQRVSSQQSGGIFPNNEDERVALFYKILLKIRDSGDSKSMVHELSTTILGRPMHSNMSEFIYFINQEIFSKLVRIMKYRLEDIEEEVNGQNEIQRESLIAFHINNSGTFIAGNVQAVNSQIEVS